MWLYPDRLARSAFASEGRGHGVRRRRASTVWSYASSPVRRLAPRVHAHPHVSLVFLAGPREAKCRRIRSNVPMRGSSPKTRCRRPLAAARKDAMDSPRYSDTTETHFDDPRLPCGTSVNETGARRLRSDALGHVQPRGIGRHRSAARCCIHGITGHSVRYEHVGRFLPSEGSRSARSPAGLRPIGRGAALRRLIRDT